MKNLVLKISEYQLKKIPGFVNSNYRQIMRLKRRYTSLRIYSSVRHFAVLSFFLPEEHFSLTAKDPLVKTAKRIGKDITFFTLDIRDTSYKFIVKLLKYMPNIVDLRIDLHNTEPCRITPFTLNKLKNLWVGECCASIFRLFVAPELQKLHFHGFSLSSDSYLENFLQASPKLQYLNITFENLKSSEYPFRLKTLIALGKDVFDEDSDAKSPTFECIKNFLLSQAATVEIFQFINFNKKLHEIVLLNFKRLKYLSFSLDEFVSAEVNRQIEPMRHLGNY